ncbi:hypothetical protein M0D45_01660 [Xanthomonas prunicola]|uniref:hypothetical protein n=1 Tax=Xanthomonas prunicola TaxID=2053930 RepID=UPI0021B25D5E|nr:hypothetical protein [Xanthomonas prunicola]UXA53532.1 hypothetical protein M0D45_01660 [Xanthomonas prunicola]
MRAGLALFAVRRKTLTCHRAWTQAAAHAQQSVALQNHRRSETPMHRADEVARALVETVQKVCLNRRAGTVMLRRRRIHPTD